MNETVAIRTPDDMHVHLRDGAMLKMAAPYTSAVFRRALVMPNLTPPVVSGRHIREYRDRICQAAGDGFWPIMAFKLTQKATPEVVREAVAGGAVAAKLYPAGVTTNSDDGVSNLNGVLPAIAELESLGAVLSVHGEQPGAFCMDREEAYLWVIERLHHEFPRLRIVLEHVTTKAAVRTVEELGPTVGATITVHHLMTTLDDVVGGMLRPHAFCKPIPKMPADRDALVAAAVFGGPQFFLGTDSAPHPVSAKESRSGCAGVFSAPVALQALASVFEYAGASEKDLERFASANGADFYGLPRNEGQVCLVRCDWRVPDQILIQNTDQVRWENNHVVPFMAGQECRWSLEA